MVQILMIWGSISRGIQNRMLRCEAPYQSYRRFHDRSPLHRRVWPWNRPRRTDCADPRHPARRLAHPSCLATFRTLAAVNTLAAGVMAPGPAWAWDSLSPAEPLPSMAARLRWLPSWVPEHFHDPASTAGSWRASWLCDGVSASLSHADRNSGQSGHVSGFGGGQRTKGIAGPTHELGGHGSAVLAGLHASRTNRRIG